MKRQKVDNGAVVPIMVPAVDVNWLSGISGKTFSEVERYYRRYRDIIDGGSGQPADVTADLVDDLDDVFAQDALWERDAGSSFTVVDHSVITTALSRLLKTVTGSGPISPTL